MAKRKLETFADYNRALKNKYGIGEYESYKPWLRVQDVTSKGVRSQIPGIKSKRKHHFMSLIETELFYLAEFSDSVVDIREQFPLLPINFSIKIAKSLDIKHPAHPVSKEPIIITTDLLLTRKINNVIVYEAFSVKPEDDSGDHRVIEKVEIERLWWELLGVKFHYYTGNHVTAIQSKNIKWATHSIRSDIPTFSDDYISASLQFVPIGKVFIKDICNDFIKYLEIKPENALELLRSLIGYRYVSVNLCRQLERDDIIEIYSKANFDLGIAHGNS
ncbi:TnsA endonuclease N-terminal domain-containing protein [Paraglaciecola chathamensis]|uniref:TnsA endonuclease n=1 Tax=Paraglaciecola chathamensis S18K6 TaxID=1127672 RepID=A0AAV3UT42_9ALTE|nr:TnsA endonuclease N-terminal domain-containing protein [Paraglaciecola chathamensis]GAC08262.1 tnsA endonuclease [Paraglaciecola chathamensis S18K6]